MAINKKLGELINLINELIFAQHTAEWYRARKYRIGGSEIADFLGCGYNTIDAAIKKKLNPTEFGFYPPCLWGTIFEDVIRKYCEYNFKTVIYETGAIPSSPEQAMSPDGIGIVDVYTADGEIEQKIALFEYKCLYGRAIKPGMPRKYLPQVLIGLETISICEFAIFFEAVIKTCELNEPGHTSRYNYENPVIYRKKVSNHNDALPKKTICWGAMAFTGENIFNESGIIDFGGKPEAYFNRLLEAIHYKKIKVHYLYQQNEGSDDHTREDILELAAHHENLIGVTRWKMIDCNEVIVNKRPFLKHTEVYARMINEFVRECELVDELTRELRCKKFIQSYKKLIDEDPNIKLIEEYAYF
jgi:hypothetical protein